MQPAFSPFPTMLSTLSKTGIIILATLNFSSANALNLFKAKILSFGQELTHYHTTLTLKNLENIVGKGENAGVQDFSPFPTMFPTLP